MKTRVETKHVSPAWDADEQRADEVLRRSEAYLAELAEKLPRSEVCLSEGQRLAHMGSWAFNAGGFQYWSSELFRIHGLDSSGKPPTVEEYLRLVHPEDRESMGQGIQKMLADHLAFDFTKRIVRPDGKIRYVRCVGSPVTHSGIFQGFVGTGIDITEQEQLTEELRRSEFYLAEGQRLSHAGSWSFKPDLTCDYWSRELYEILGFDPRNGIPTISDYFTRVHPGDRAVVEATIQGMITAGEGCDLKKRIIRPDGAQRVIRCVGMPVRENGAVTRFVGTLMDITEQEELTQELRRREAYLTEAQRLSHTGSFGWKPDTGGIIWSAETYLIFEYDRAVTPTIDLVVQRVHPEDRADVQSVIERASGGAPDFEHAYRLLLPDGKIKHIHALAHATQDALGHREFVGAVTDITKQKQAEESLRASESYLTEAQKLSHTGSWAWSPDADITYWSEECYRVLGFDQRDGLPRSEEFFRRIHPDDLPALRDSAKKAKDSKVDEKVFYRIVHPGGAVRDIYSIGRPVFSPRGDLIAYTGTVIDITERKRAEGELRASEQKYRQLVDTTPAFVHTALPNGDLDFFNRGWLEYLGLSIADLLGWRWMSAIHPEDVEEFAAKLREALESGEAFVGESRVRRADGEYRWFLHREEPLRNEAGEIVKWYGSSIEIEERKIGEEAIRRGEAFLAEGQRLSHTGSFGWNVVTGERTWSEENYRILGYDPSVKPTFERVRDRVHPDDLHLWLKAFAQASEGKQVDFEHRLLMPDGSVKHLHVVAYGVRRDGKYVELVGTAMDVTESKKAEEALRRSEAFLAEGQRLSHTGSWVWNPSTGEMTSSKERFLIFGLDPEKTKPSFDVFWERVHPEDKPRFKRVFDSAVREKSDFKIGHRIVTPDWVIKHVHTVAHAITNESGELIEFIGSTMDITERKRAEERAQSQNNEVKLALNAFVEELDLNRFLGHVITGLTKQFQATASELWLSEGSSRTAKLFMTCEQGKVVWADEREPTGLPPRATHITRERPDIGRIPRIIELPAHKSLLRPAHLESLKHQGIKTLLLVPLVLGEQNLGFVELRFAVATRLTADDVNLAQALVHHATLALQLSRLAHRTEQMAVTEERNRLAREIHDTLAQAFAGIVLHAEALGTSLEGSKTRSRKSLLNIQKLARSGLEEARRSVQALRPKALDDRSLTQALEEAAKRLSEDAKLSCEFKQRGKALEMPVEMQNELFRVAQEAMTNLRKHARATSAWINLEFKSRRVILTIRDNGVGLAATNSSKRKQGYGLATMRERALHIGGKLEIESPASGGTAIRVVVPLAKKLERSNYSI